VGQQAYVVVPLDGLSMATSGDYRIYFEQGGRRYSHEIDPVTREPVKDRLASVSVVAKDCAWADAMATALFVMGADRAYAFAERSGMAAFFIERAEGGRLTDRQTAAFAKLGAERAPA
jgi:thiamine biosynthesis lipoprotein